MRSKGKGLLKNRKALERFRELLRDNPGKYVLVTEEGEGFVLSSDAELSRVLEGRGLKAFYLAHKPPKEIKYFVF